MADKPTSPHGKYFLTLVFASILFVLCGIFVPNAFAMGAQPGSCNNEYDGPIVAAQINLRNQTFDPLFGPRTSIELVMGNYYNLAFTIHNPSLNKNGNSLPGEEWTHTDVNGFANGACVGGAVADQNMTVSGSFSGHMSDVSWSTLVSGFSYHVNWVAAGSQDFTPAAWPSHFRIHAGDSASSIISVTSVDKFNGTVSLSASSPSDITTSFDSSSLNVSPGMYASSKLNISTSPTATGQYTITFSASNGTQTQSGVIALTVYPYVPSAPKNISGNPGNGKVSLSWSAPSDDGTSAITNYDIYRGTSSSGETLLGQIGNVLNYTDSTVTNGQTYYYYVKAENSVGQGSASLEYITTPTEAGPFKITTVSVGKYPQSVGVNPVKNLAYVANQRDNTVSVIDGVTGSVINTISTGTFPNGVAVNTNTNKIYVTNLGSNTVSVIDGNTNSVVSTIPVGQNPYGIAVNPVTNKIYAASISGGLDVIDGNTNSVVSTIPVSVGQEVAVNPITNKIYAVASGNNAVNVIDGTTDSVVSTIPLGYTPLGVAVNPNTNMIYVSENPIWNGPNEGIVSVINGSTNSIVSRIPLAGNYEIGVNPNTNIVYLASNDATGTFDDVVYAIDGFKNKVMNIISVGADPYGIGINPNTGKIYVTNEDANTVSIISTSSSVSTVPSAPQNLTTIATTSSQINLSWTAPTNNGGAAITGYEIERSVDNGSTWSTLQSNTGSTAITYSDTGLSPNTTYAYRVSAINSVGTSSPSNVASATTLAILTVITKDVLGNAITGIWIELHSANGDTIATGYTPVKFDVVQNTQYAVYAANYLNYVFLHWDDGSMSNPNNITPAGNETLTATYTP